MINIEGSGVSREFFEEQFSKWGPELNIQLNEINNRNVLIIENNGGIYIGDISLDGKRDGIGLSIYPNKDVHYGNWKNDQLDGLGRFYFNDGRRFVGDYFNNVHSEGELLMGDGSNYNGAFINGKFNGYGEMYYSDDNFYHGQWKDGEKDNFGIMYYENGDIYEGIWFKNKQHGYGKTIFNNGEIYEGEYKNGECHGDGTVYFTDGSTFNGEWINGQPIKNFNQILPN